MSDVAGVLGSGDREQGVLRPTERWRRLDPRMLLVHPVTEVVRFLPALLGVFLIGRSSDDGGWWRLAAIGVPIALGLLRYLTTKYRVVDGQLELRRGLVQRRVLTTRLDRIRTVEVTASPIHRLLRLAKVEIGTGSAVGSVRLRLDSLPLAEARAMRTALLSRTVPGPAASSGVAGVAGDDSAAAAGGARPVGAGPAAAGASDGASFPAGASATGAAAQPPAAGAGRFPGSAPRAGIDDAVLLRWDPRWIRYAPLTSSGLVIGAAVLGASTQFIEPLTRRLVGDSHLGAAAASTPLWVLIVAAIVVFGVVISVLAIAGYILANWGFALSENRAGRQFHVARGLLTSRETSIDTDRVRGVEFHQPLGLRWAGAARLAIIVTGMSQREAGVATVVPPAPRDVSVRATADLLGDAGSVATRLTGHGPRATVRRYTRALAVAAAIAAGWVVLVMTQGWDPWLLVGAALPVLVALPLAGDRARRLGHGLVGDYLVMQSHSLRGRRAVLLRDGIIGWNLRQSLFQRRAGLVTMTATTSAGKQGYRSYDVPERVAVALADEAVPGLLTPFLVDQPD